MDNNNRLRLIWGGLARNPNWKNYVEAEDIETFDRRSASEGVAFWAIGLAACRAALLTGLETGHLPAIPQFGLKRETCLPRFLHRAWAAIFDDSGHLRGDMDIGAVTCINQLTAVFYKIKGNHAPSCEKEVIARFESVEAELASTSIDTTVYVGKAQLGPILREALSNVCRVIGDLSPFDITPKHGSGVSSCGTPKWARYELPRISATSNVTECWPVPLYFTAGASHLCDVLQEYRQAETTDELRAKVLLVPKDVRGPRLISCEPREHMFIQQGLMAALVRRIESHPLTRQSVKFTDQRANQRAARAGSLNWKQNSDSNLATLDLKDASDRIRMDLVWTLFPRTWGAALYACRSAETVLPDGRVVRLHKHAPMGSATCFPVMALCLWAILKAALPPNTRILVYGDDIVVPARYVERAVQVLTAVHLRVNVAKSFWRGPYRESCGKEYVKGVDVTPTYLRHMPGHDFESRDSIIAFANQLFVKYDVDWLHTYIREWYEEYTTKRGRRISYPVPEVTYTPRMTTATWSPEGRLVIAEGPAAPLPGVLWVYSADNRRLKVKWCKDENSFYHSYLVAEPVKVSYPTDDWSQLFRALVNPNPEEPLGLDALTKRVKYKKRWRPLLA